MSIFASNLIFFYLFIISSMSAASGFQLPSIQTSSKSTKYSNSLSRRRDHHAPSPGTTEQEVPKVKRPRDAKRNTFDAWLASTECNLANASVEDVIVSAIDFAKSSQRSTTDLTWAPAGMARALKKAQEDLTAGRIVELRQGRNPSRWKITAEIKMTAEITPVKPTNNQVHIDKRLVGRLYADRKELKVRS
jgi:hypothetical protein|mmetsp:Transcript_10393/g.20761  ORF Transcript_10393/g.20761 Transcript_10393/m.20761 type:complete len:191 (+) Transcript_10393:96-668(+)